MNTQKMIVILVSMALATIGGLLYLAMAGNTWAVGILFGGWTIICLAVGFGGAVWQYRAMAARTQQSFMANAKENLALMGAMQTVQNRQNQTLMSQLSTVARLPQAPAPVDSLLIEDGIFNELDA